MQFLYLVFNLYAVLRGSVFDNFLFDASPYIFGNYLKRGGIHLAIKSFYCFIIMF